MVTQLTIVKCGIAHTATTSGTSRITIIGFVICFNSTYTILGITHNMFSESEDKTVVSAEHFSDSSPLSLVLDAEATLC